MRVFNLTDVATPALEQRGLVSQHIAVGGRMLNPGEFADVEDSRKVRSDLEYLLTVGAVSIDGLPPPYTLARQQAEAVSGRLGERVGQHIDMKETKTAGEPLPGPPAEGTTAVLSKNDPTVAESDTPSEEPPPPSPPANVPKKKPR